MIKISQYLHAHLNHLNWDYPEGSSSERVYPASAKEKLITDLQNTYRELAQAQKDGLLENLSDISNTFFKESSQLLERHNISKENIFKAIVIRNKQNDTKIQEREPALKMGRP